MSIYQNEGATCPTCLWQEPALQGDVNARYQCKKCRTKNGRPGWDPKPEIIVNTYQGLDSKGKIIFFRKVVG